MPYMHKAKELMCVYERGDTLLWGERSKFGASPQQLEQAQGFQLTNFFLLLAHFSTISHLLNQMKNKKSIGLINNPFKT